MNPILVAVMGCAAVWTSTRPISIRVPLELTSPTVLENDLVHFKNPPENLKPPFCYPIDDIRFAYVHTIYYATKQLRRMPAPFHRIEIEIAQAPGEMPAGASMYRKVWFHTPSPAIDPTVIAHELGHEIHDELVGHDVTEIAAPSFVAGRWEKAMGQLGVIEGTANLLAALETGQSRMGAFTYADAAMDIDTFVRFPDEVPSLETALRRFIGTAGFRVLYPKTVTLLEEQLRAPSEMLKHTLRQPDAYLASAAINQPMWQAARRFGFASVEASYVDALRGYESFGSYSDLARRILAVTENKKPLRDYLLTEFSRRGL